MTIDIEQALKRLTGNAQDHFDQNDHFGTRKKRRYQLGLKIVFLEETTKDFTTCKQCFRSEKNKFQVKAVSKNSILQLNFFDVTRCRTVRNNHQPNLKRMLSEGSMEKHT